MSRRGWVRLDNASNIFLAAWTGADPKVFRIAAEMDAPVDADLLQRALEKTFDRYPLYRAVLRRGIFWYYLQDSELRPQAEPESLHTCAPLYHVDRQNLLFRVVHHEHRISLEVFHALSDGTGALWFLTDLVNAYTALQHPGCDAAAAITGGDPLTDRHPLALLHPPRGLAPDSFGHYFRGKDESADDAPPVGPRRTSWRTRHVSGVHRVRGTRTPDDRPRLVELSMPADQVLVLAKAHGTSVTLFLTALFFEAIRLSSRGLGRSRTIAASVPVNLRQFFPSLSPRNFFATVRVEHTYGAGHDDLKSICAGLEEQFRPEATPQSLEKRLRGFLRFERYPLLRVVPRPLKDVLLRLINWGNNRALTVAVSNLGRVVLPEPAEAHVRRLAFHVSAVRPQFCSISHDGVLTISFTSPFQETGHIREFARMLTEQGVEVSAAATRVTAPEIREAGEDPLRGGRRAA